MTQEERQLLFKDLCARLPYGVIIHADEFNIVGELIDINIPYNTASIRIDEQFSQYTPAPIVDVKPYLRPMSSMTDGEKKELKSATCPKGTGYFDEKYLICPMNHYGEQISYEFMQSIIDWLNAHHFDFRNLIEKGLALEAPEGIYKIK